MFKAPPASVRENDIKKFHEYQARLPTICRHDAFGKMLS